MCTKQIASYLLAKGHTDLAIELDPTLIQSSAPHPGAMVAITASDAVLDFVEENNLLDFEGSSNIDDLHVTLVYLAADAVQDIPATQMNDIVEVCLEVAANHGPMEMQISGFGKFLKDDSSQVIYSSINSVGLNELRADLAVQLDSVVNYPKDFGFTPHLTLGFVPAGHDVDIPSVDPTTLPKWSVDAFTLVAAGDYSHFRMQS